MVQKIMISGISFLFAIASGIWLSKLGKPYNGALFNVHKLVALTSVIVTGVFMYTTLKGNNVDEVIMVLIVLSIVSIIVLFISGALLSAGVGPYALMNGIHIIVTIAAVVGIAVTVYFALAGLS